MQPAPHAAKREQLRQIVGRVILDQHHEIDDVERVSRRRRDLIECEAMETLLAKPASELVSIICWNLHLSPKWSDLVCEDWPRPRSTAATPARRCATG